jgi:SAM-dependent methyltransferase
VRRTPFNRVLWALYPRVYDRLWDDPLTASLTNVVMDELPPDLPVEEVGAGSGLFTKRIAQAGLTVTASEPNSRMRQRFAKRLPSVELIDATIDRLPPVRQAPCSVVAANVLHLTSDPMDALAVLRRRAGRGGRVVVVTPSPRATLSRVARAQRRNGKSRRATLGFVLLHVLLAPVTILAGGQATPRRLARVNDVDALDKRTIEGVARVLVFEGDGEGVTARAGAVSQ